MLTLVHPSSKTLFPYVPYPYISRHPGDKTGRCPIEIKQVNGKVIVTVTEPDSHAINNEIQKDFDGIARQIYRTHLRGTPLSDVKWVYHSVRDDDGFETLSDVKFDSSLQKPEFRLTHRLANYTFGGMEFTSTELVLYIGFHMNEREHRYPLSRFPVLQNATEKNKEVGRHTNTQRSSTSIHLK